jgi:hypothetical protein
VLLIERKQNTMGTKSELDGGVFVVDRKSEVTTIGGSLLWRMGI